MKVARTMALLFRQCYWKPETISLLWSNLTIVLADIQELSAETGSVSANFNDYT